MAQNKETRMPTGAWIAIGALGAVAGFAIVTAVQNTKELIECDRAYLKLQDRAWRA